MDHGSNGHLLLLVEGGLGLVAVRRDRRDGGLLLAVATASAAAARLLLDGSSLARFGLGLRLLCLSFGLRSIDHRHRAPALRGLFRRLDLLGITLPRAGRLLRLPLRGDPALPG